MFSAIREERFGSSDQTGRRPRRRVGALSGAVALVAVVALALPAGALAQVNMRTPTGYAANQFRDHDTNPSSVAIGHLDADSHPDLVVTNTATDHTSVLYGRAGGTFGALLGTCDVDLGVARDRENCPDNMMIGQGSYASQLEPVSVAVGDFDADSRSDLAVLNRGVRSDGTYEVAVDLAAGRYPQTYQVGPSPVAVAVGDFNGDSHPDLAVASNNGATGGTTTPPCDGAACGSVSVLINKGDGTFGPASSYTADKYPSSVAVRDFDGDSHRDLAVANYGSNNVSVLFGDGGGGFGDKRNYSVGTKPRSLAAGDFNDDLHPDLAVANQGSNNVSLLFGGGGRSFYSSDADTIAVDYQPRQVAVGNFDGDSDPDLAILTGLNKVWVQLGKPGRSFGAMPYSPYNLNASNSLGLAVGDVDGDKDDDVAVTVERALSGSGRPDSDGVTVLLDNRSVTGAGNAYTTDQDKALYVAAPGVLGNDSDPDGDKLKAALAAGPEHGAVTLLSDGSFHYTPSSGYSGSDSFQYTVSDTFGGWNVVTVTLTVRAAAGA